MANGEVAKVAEAARSAAPGSKAPALVGTAATTELSPETGRSTAARAAGSVYVAIHCRPPSSSVGTPSATACAHSRPSWSSEGSVAAIRASRPACGDNDWNHLTGTERKGHIGGRAAAAAAVTTADPGIASPAAAAEQKGVNSHWVGIWADSVAARGGSGEMRDERDRVSRAPHRLPNKAPESLVHQ